MCVIVIECGHAEWGNDKWFVITNKVTVDYKYVLQQAAI